MTEARPRPSQVTVATVLGVVGAALFVVGLFDFSATIRSVEFRSDVQDYLTKNPRFDLTVDRVVDASQIGVLAAGVIAAIAFVFAIYLRQGHKGARVGFTMAAVLLVPGMRVSANLFLGSFLLVLGVAWLWSRPVRDWYAGRVPQPRGLDGGGVTGVPPLLDQRSPVQPSSAEQTPQGPGVEISEPPPYPAYAQLPAPTVSAPVPAYAAAGFDGRRPMSVIWAAVLTWVCSGLVGVVTFLAVVVIATDRDSVIGDVQDQVDSNSTLQDMGVTADQVLNLVLVVCVLIVLWCIVSAVFALLTLLGYNWARIVLAISAAASALASLVAILAVAPIVTLAAGIVVVVLLFNARANAWFTRRTRQGQHALDRQPAAPATQSRPPRRPW